MRFIVIDSRVVLSRSGPVTGRLSTPTLSIGSGCWPAARAISAAREHRHAPSGSPRTAGPPGRSPGRGKAVVAAAPGRQQGGGQAPRAGRVLTWELRGRAWRVAARGRAAPAPVNRRSGSDSQPERGEEEGVRRRLRLGGATRHGDSGADLASRNRGSSSTWTTAGAPMVGSFDRLGGLARVGSVLVAQHGLFRVHPIAGLTRLHHARHRATRPLRANVRASANCDNSSDSTANNAMVRRCKRRRSMSS